MKVRLERLTVIDDGGLPSAILSQDGIALPDATVIQYENIRSQYLAARCNLIEAYKKAGGVY